MERVLAKGMTPAGTHVPIMLQECLQHLGLSSSPDDRTYDSDSPSSSSRPLLAVDCTLGFGGHSSHMMKELVDRGSRSDADITGTSRLVAFDRDSVEIVRAEARLREQLKVWTTERRDDGDDEEQSREENETRFTFTTVNANFQNVGSYLRESDQMGHVTSLLADLGLSSMQIDDNMRGFTFKREGPLDMRMNNEGDETGETAFDLLSRLKPKQLKRMLEENSDEVYATEIADGLLGGRRGEKKIPATTLELAEKVRDIVQPLMEKQPSPKKGAKNKAAHLKKQLDKTVARVMQAIRIEVNGEFLALEQLLDDLPHALAPGGRVVFLTFHSGEDRRVKKSFKAGFKSGIYSGWSRDVVRPTGKERRDNPRSSCCKLRWAIRAE